MTYKRNLPSFGLIASAGLIPGISRYRRFGVNDDIDTGSTPEYLGVQSNGFTFPTSADTVEIVSDSANDTAAGTGTRALFISGLNADYEEISEVVPLNGLTAVTSTLEYLIIHICYGVSAGSNENNVDHLTITHTTSGNTLAEIGAGKGRTQQIWGIVPKDTEWFIDTLRFNVQNKSSSATGIIDVQIQPFGTNHWQTLNTYELTNSASGINVKTGHADYIIIPAKAKYRVLITFVTSNNTEVSGNVGGYFVRKGFSY
jgi:hypothetical protein